MSPDSWELDGVDDLDEAILMLRGRLGILFPLFREESSGVAGEDFSWPDR